MRTPPSWWREAAAWADRSRSTGCVSWPTCSAGPSGPSRAACDAGWVDHSLQVGLTGKSVTPDLYVTVGISGASQHMAGCSGSRNIVAINRDADANIFRDASYGVAGDWQKVLPAFIEAVRELVS